MLFQRGMRSHWPSHGSASAFSWQELTNCTRFGNGSLPMLLLQQRPTVAATVAAERYNASQQRLSMWTLPQQKFTRCVAPRIPAGPFNVNLTYPYCKFCCLWCRKISLWKPILSCTIPYSPAGTSFIAHHKIIRQRKS